MKTFLLLSVFVTSFVFAQKDTLNVTDTNGMLQGKWMLLGADVPEFGIESGSIAETGTYQNNQKIGPWIRYNKTGTLPLSLIIYEFNASGNQSTRVSIFSFKYFDNGQVSYLPYAGKCKTKANYKRFDESGKLIELMEYDSLGNEILSITATDNTALEGMDYFDIPADFQVSQEANVVTPSIKKFTQQNGYYIVDVEHSKFVVGRFENGDLVEGKECVLDETYKLMVAKTFSDRRYSSTYSVK